ncbi:phage tail tape measure protein [Niallia sp. MER 6]|uniref:phage tail tape measure protein n=1 Tax=Niallia sp. MER 6 TaxID=2939567 RepID=UPI00204239C2|nr:phage tail tape measure protein [Niallia sp. MER 6]MCM3032836.1 phage tail tape measure protein [Niallia sp. MER 6]
MANQNNISFRISAQDDFTHVFRSLENSVSGLQSTVSGMGRQLSSSLSSVNGSAQQTSQQVGSLSRSVSNASGSMVAAGTAMSGAGIAIAGALGFGANKAMDFEAQLSSVKAVSGATAEEMATLEQIALDAGASTKYSALESAQGIEELIKAGVSLDDIMSGGLEGALNLATAGGLELAEAAEIASTALNAFKSDNLEVVDAANLLAGAANASATDVGELKYGLSMVSAVASGIGLSFKDTSTALASFAQNGLKGSDAGTSLKTMLLNLSPATDGAAEQMKDLGLATADGQSKFYDANGSIKSLAEIAELLKTQLADLTDEQRQMALKTMFGTDAIRAANILYKEGADGINSMYKEMSKVTAADVAAEKLKNVRGQMEQLSGSVETLAISFGDALLPLISGIVSALQWVADKFNALSAPMKSVIAISGVLVAGLLLIGGPILALIGFLPSIIAGIQLLGVALGAVMSPVTLIIAGIVGLGVALVAAYNHVGWFRGMVDAAWEWIKNAFFTALEYINGVVQWVMSDISAFIGEQLAKVQAFWDDNGAAIMTLVQTYFGVVWEYIQMVMGLIQGIFQMVWPIIVGVLEAAWETIKAVVETAIDLVLGIIQTTMKILQGDWEGAWETIKDTAESIMENIIGIFEGIDLQKLVRTLLMA